MKAVCHTDPTNPYKSLVKSICYPAELAFISKQTNWGLKQEKVAKELYLKINTPSHDNFTVRDSGLVINPQWPFVGASPDGLIECRCCGKGTLEVKCPPTHIVRRVLHQLHQMIAIFIGGLMMVIVHCILIADMHTTTKCKLRCLYAMLSIVTSVCVLFLQRRQNPHHT